MSHLANRIIARTTESDDGCWLFLGALSSGYGVISYLNRSTYTHRVMYEYFISDIPTGLQIDHLCRVRSCCNPWHLEPVTVAVNVARGEARLTSGDWRAEFERSKTACPLDHPYDVANTYFTPRGDRQCRICKADAGRRYGTRHRERINAEAREARGYTGPISACRRAGHEYTPENTYINPTSGRRICIACRRDRVTARDAA